MPQAEGRARRIHRMSEEPKWRNQFTSSLRPTLPYVPHLEPDEDSKYQMAGPEPRATEAST